MTVKVLVVDDNNISREVISELLVKQGWLVTTAKNGLQGLHFCNHQQFDAVVTGFYMPLLDGPHFVKILKRNPQFADIPVAMLSTRTEQEVMTHFEQNELALFIRKPLNNATKQQFLDKLTALIVASEHKAA
ncbi:response regulator [Shewanella marina]|uniref:response regulator n=1 Tax=Shewanella marina TaxID=487319 RepID=UPI00046ED3CA|nr:response regulator [Shewanella marina]